MTTTTVVCYRWITRLFGMLLGVIVPPSVAAEVRVDEAYGRIPLHFEPNRGQAHKDVRFLSRGPGYSLFLTAAEAVLVLAPTPTQADPLSVRISLAGALPAPQVSGRDQRPGKTSYFVGSDPARWRTNLPLYAKVHYRTVYPGIDLVFYGDQRGLEYDFIVAPGADPAGIVLEFHGADRLEIDSGGDLLLHAGGGVLRQKKPVVYQDVEGARRIIEGGYVRRSANRFGFELASHDATRELVIDPMLSYATYLGGSGADGAIGIARSPDGSAYITGTTSSPDFPATPGAAVFGGLKDIFVAKISPGGQELVYSAYFGGSDVDESSGIAVDQAGNAYLTGVTYSTDFPVTPGAFQTAPGAQNRSADAFAAKINAAGSALIYSTFLGGSGEDVGLAVATDAAGHAYVTGYTSSPDYPKSAGALQAAHGGGNDAFVTKLEPLGTAALYSTLLGGGRQDYGRGIKVDGGGSAYVTGSTDSFDFPTTPGAFRSSFAGGWDDPFVAKLNPSGTGLAYSTYLGGSNNDRGSGIAIDGSGHAYIVGTTWSFDFPVTPGAYQTVYGGGEYDAYVAKLAPDGSSLVYATYLGGVGLDYGQGIALDAFGNAYVAGITYSPNFPVTAGAIQPVYSGGAPPAPADAFVAKLNANGNGLIYSSYLGGTGEDQAFGIAVDGAGIAYVAGSTGSANFPTTQGVLQPALAGGSDAFVARITGFSTLRAQEGAAMFVGTWTTYGPETGTFSGSTMAAAHDAGASTAFIFTGTSVTWVGVRCNVCGTATVAIDGGVPTTVNTAGPAAPGNLTSEPVFSASGLAPGVNHTLLISTTGTSTSSGPHVAIDAFDVSQ